MTDGPKSKLWVFLNSNFGLFMMSSIVLSFMTWSYTQWTDSLEKKKVLSEKLTKLETEVSYRVQVMQNYFESECSEHSNLSRKTFKDIDEICGDNVGLLLRGIGIENARDFVMAFSDLTGLSLSTQFLVNAKALDIIARGSSKTYSEDDFCK